MMPNAENSNSKTTEEYRDALSDRVLSKTLLGWKSFKESTWMIIFKSAAKFRIYRDNFPPHLLNLYYYTTASASLVISPIYTTSDFQLPKNVFHSYGTTSVGMVLSPISNTGRDQIKPPIASLSKSALSWAGRSRNLTRSMVTLNYMCS